MTAGGVWRLPETGAEVVFVRHLHEEENVLVLWEGKEIRLPLDEFVLDWDCIA